MIPTSRTVKTVLALFLLGCLFTSTNAQNDDDANVRRVAEQFFAAFQHKDLTGVMALWSGNSPDLTYGRQLMQQTFATYRTIEVKKLDVNKIAVETNNATVQLMVELNVVSTQPNASASPLQWIRTIQLVKETGTWKVWKYLTREDELAAKISAVSTAEERSALLHAQPELMTPDLVIGLTKQARDLLVQGKQTQGLPILDMASNVAGQIKDKRGMFYTLRLKSVVARTRGDYKQALEYLDQCLKLAEELGDKTIIGDTLNSLAVIYALQSDYPKALALFQRNLKIKEELGNKIDIAIELLNIGNVHIYQGDKVRALEYYQRSLRLSEEVGDKGTVAATLNSIGNLYSSQDNYAQALEYFQQSLKIKQEIGDRLGVARALNNIGVMHSIQGQHDQGLDYLQQSVKILEELGDKLVLTEAWHYTGGVYLLLGKYEGSLTYNQRALKLAEELGNKQLQSEILQNMSESYLRLGQHQVAGEFAGRAAALAAQFGIPDIFWNAKTIAGQAHLALNQPDLARRDFLESIAAIEKLRGQVAGGEQDQQRFFENKIDPYQAMVQLSLAQQDTAAALSYAERAKGRVLLDVLSSGRANITKAMTSDELKRDRELSTEIATLNTQLARLKMQSKPPDAQVADVQGRLDKARLEYEAFQASLYAAHPELKVQRGETQPLTLDELAALLPDAQTAILEYVVTEDKSYLFVIRKPRYKAAELTVFTLEVKSKDLAQMAESFLQKVAERDLTIKQPARRLYDLLIKPAETQLRGVRKLYIVPDGTLWNVPFQALHQGQRGYLLEQYGISYAPSLSVLREMGRRGDALRKGHHGSATARANTHSTLLAMGNPALSGATKATVRVTRRDEPLGPLPEAEKEVNTLGRLYGRSSKVLIGAEAQEATMKAEAARYKVLHFATHAILDDRNPLYSHILLSRTDYEDGLLEAWEIMKLDLNAELAVLSACETARGRIAAGEGIIGMSWALFVAGSPAAVVSQWKVDSARSSELMIEFHRNLLQRRMTKSEALRQAALKVFRGAYNHPAYWAGFILIGEDN